MACLGYENPTVADAIASRNPCRIIALCPVAGRRRREGSALLTSDQKHRQLRSSAVARHFTGPVLKNGWRHDPGSADWWSAEVSLVERDPETTVSFAATGGGLHSVIVDSRGLALQKTNIC